MISGALCALRLPVKQYPNIAPPQIIVVASYPGADAQTIALTIGTPLEEAVNGVEHMLYMSSTSSNNGTYALSITFESGTDPDMAMIKVQNRIRGTTSRLPQIVNTIGITINATTSNMIGALVLVSPKGTRDNLFLTNYASSNVVNRLKRIPGMGSINVIGSGYSIRIWIDPEKLSSMNLNVSDVATAVQTQNIQAALGTVGSAPSTETQEPILYSMISKGRLSTAAEFE